MALSVTRGPNSTIGIAAQGHIFTFSKMRLNCLN